MNIFSKKSLMQENSVLDFIFETPLFHLMRNPQAKNKSIQNFNEIYIQNNKSVAFLNI